jgi:HEAT repeat protein
VFPLVFLVVVVLSGRGVQGDQVTQPAEMVERFKAETVFWTQLEIAESIVLAKDTGILLKLEPWLAHPDRHVRGNTAFIFGSLGDPRGFDVIAAILGDESDRPEGQGAACVLRGDGKPCWSVRLQIAADRYYAVHLLGLLKDPRAVPILVSFLGNPDVNYKIPWALMNIGGKCAIAGLIKALRNSNPEVRVFAVEDLEDLHAVEALPELLPLLGDDAMSSYDRRGYVEGGIAVSSAARAAIATLQHS